MINLIIDYNEVNKFDFYVVLMLYNFFADCVQLYMVKSKMVQYAIIVKNARKAYGEKAVILNNLNLSVPSNTM